MQNKFESLVIVPVDGRRKGVELGEFLVKFKMLIRNIKSNTHVMYIFRKGINIDIARPLPNIAQINLKQIRMRRKIYLVRTRA